MAKNYFRNIPDIEYKDDIIGPSGSYGEGPSGETSIGQDCGPNMIWDSFTGGCVMRQTPNTKFAAGSDKYNPFGGS